MNLINNSPEINSTGSIGSINREQMVFEDIIEKRGSIELEED
jgi:hypothetical protein